MIDIALLRAIIAYRGYSQKDMAKKLDITYNSFYKKMKIGIFGTSEITKMIDLLQIKNPEKVFFADQPSDGNSHEEKILECLHH